jgi:hypothetical protein
LELGDACAGGKEDKLLIEKAVDGRLGHAAEARGAVDLEGAADGGEMLAERFEGGGRVDAGCRHQEGAVPGHAVLGGEPVRAEGQKDVGSAAALCAAAQQVGIRSSRKTEIVLACRSGDCGSIGPG